MNDFADGHLANIIVQSSTRAYTLQDGRAFEHTEKKQSGQPRHRLRLSQESATAPCLGVLLCWIRAFVQKSKSVLNTCGSSRSTTHKECRHPFTTSTPKTGLRPRNPSR